MPNKSKILRNLFSSHKETDSQSGAGNTISICKDIVSNIGLGLNVFKLVDTNDSGSFKLELINSASEKLTRFSNPNNIGKTLDEISPLMRQFKFHNIFDNALKSNTTQEIENFVYHPDSSRSPLIFNLKIFPLPDNRVAMLIEDTTAKNNAETILKMNQFGMENAGDIILWLNENAQFVFVNETACKKYEYTRQELMGMGMTDIDPRITMMQWYELIQILDSKPSLTMESLNRSKSGEIFPVEISVNKFIYDGKKNYFTLIRDISERKRNDELEQKINLARNAAALKQQFLANMSHEIRTPMTGIMGMTSLLLKTELDERQQEYVKNIKISSDNLLNIINDVLDLSKIEAGKMELKPSQLTLKKFVEEIRDMYIHIARQKELEFSASVDPAIPPVILVDENRLKQVINNLLSNAFKFTDAGQISLNINLLEKRDNRLKLVCDVQDSGIGISEENQLQIFEKFTQLSNSLVRPFEGTGLGLAISKELTRMLGGEISVESQLGKGSTFIFTFEALVDEEASMDEQTSLRKEIIDLKLRILHVEDKVLNQKVVELILKNAGCIVDFVKNGQEAIEKYDPDKYDIVLMDIDMPVMDGITAYKELKKLHGNNLCPVIGLSANALEGDARKFMEQGLDDYISKPFKPEFLYNKLKYWKSQSNS